MTFCQAAQQWGLPAGCCPTTACASPASCAASRCCSKPTCATSGCDPSPAAPTTPRPPARSNGSSRPSRNGSAANPSPPTSTSCKPNSTSSAASTTTSDPTKASAASPRSAGGTPAPARDPTDEPARPPRLVDAHRSPSPSTPPATSASTGSIIHVGVEWDGHQANVLIDHGHANVFIDGQLIRHLRIDRRRRYQPSGRPRGGPRQARPYRPDCHPCPATYVSPMSRDRTPR